MAGLPHNFWYAIGTHKLSYETACKIPQSLLLITLISNFGTFALYMMSCVIAMVAFHEHHMHSFFKHKAIPLFGVVANLVCMLFYLIGPIQNTPFSVAGMGKAEPYCALAAAAIWGLYGLIYFARNSKAKGREMILTAKPAV